MKLSFVIPVYNSSGFIVSALQSVRTEARGRPHEIILIDDKSSDIQELFAITNRISEVVVIEKEEKTNAADSRNIGIRKATGDIVFLLDSDDQLEPGVVDRRIKIHESNRAGLVFGNYVVRRGYVERRVNLPVYFGEDVRDYLMLKNGDFRTSTISIYRPFFKGTMFDENSRKHQDWIYGIRAFDNGEVIDFDESKSALIVSDRAGRMSSSINVPASKYFVENYLLTQDQKNGFSRKHWKSLVECKDKLGREFFISIYHPKKFTDWAYLTSIKVVSSRMLSHLFSRLVVFARKVKYLF